MLNTLALLTVMTAAAPADSVTGNWRVTADVMGNAMTSVCTFAQEGTALTGSCSGAGGGRQEVTGQVAEGKVTFQYRAEYEGQPLTVVYSGALNSPTEFRGTMLVQPFDVGGAFTATRVAENQ
jgi:hypothetical protein